MITHLHLDESKFIPKMERHILLFPATVKFYSVHLIGEYSRSFVKKSDRCSHCELHHSTKYSHPHIIGYSIVFIPLSFNTEI